MDHKLSNIKNIASRAHFLKRAENELWFQCEDNHELHIHLDNSTRKVKSFSLALDGVVLSFEHADEGEEGLRVYTEKEDTSESELSYKGATVLDPNNEIDPSFYAKAFLSSLSELDHEHLSFIEQKISTYFN